MRKSHLLPSLVVLSLCTLLGTSAHATPADPEIARVKIAKLGPTQEEIGQAAVDSMTKFFLGKRGRQRIDTYLRGDFRRQFEGKTYEGVRDPNGVVRILDGHHRAKMLLDLGKRYNVPFTVKVKILRDYTGQTMDQYARDLLHVVQKGQFAMATRRKHPLRSGDNALVGRLKRLPKTVGKCKDSPLRAGIGITLFGAGFDSDHFIDYVEFKLADRLYRTKGVPTNRAFVDGLNSGDQRKVNNVVRALSKALLHPQNVKYLENNIRTGSEVQAREIVAKLKQTKTYRAHRRLQRVRAAGYMPLGR